MSQPPHPIYGHKKRRKKKRKPAETKSASAKQYDKAVSHGFCGACRNRMASPGHFTCLRCRDNMTMRNKTKMENKHKAKLAALLAEARSEEAKDRAYALANRLPDPTLPDEHPPEEPASPST